MYTDIDADILLEIREVAKSFRGIQALVDCNLKIHPNELLGVIDLNGTGKTTLFNLIHGLIRPSRGQILFQGRDAALDWPSCSLSIPCAWLWAFANTF